MPHKKVPMKTEKRFNFSVTANALTEVLTPKSKQFVIYHLGIPELDTSNWSLCIDGMIKNPCEITYEQLLDLPQVRVRAFHECVGNPLKPTIPVRRVNQIEWMGVRLRTILDRAGIKDGARYLWASGADSGVYEFTGVHVDEYQKDLPLEKALEDEVLLATHLNGEPLADSRGGPVRLIVPGYYSTCSVKWLTKLEVRSVPSPAYFADELYNEIVVENGVELKKRLWHIAPHSVIVSHSHAGDTPLGPQRIWGWSWGHDEILKVEVSTDDGVTWSLANLDSRKGWHWQRFEFDWQPPAAGEYLLACRATDSRGSVQPIDGARNEIFKIAVTVS